MDGAAPASPGCRPADDGHHRGLPPWTYRNAALSRLEHARIMLPSWQLVCHDSDLPEPGAYLTFDLGRESILAVRDRAGEVRCFHNVCSHRAARLLDGTGVCRGAVTCPYHGWTYELSGHLRALPAHRTFPGLDLAQFGLRPIRTDRLAGFVFACLDGDPVPVAQMWGDMALDFEPYRFADMRPLAPIYTEQWEVDWKVAMDNYLESYHVPVGHPGMARMLTPDYDDQTNLPSGVARGIGWLRDVASTQWSGARYQAMVEALTTDLPAPNRRCWRFYSMLPNIGIDVYPDQIDFFQVLPNGPGSCTIRGGTYGLPDERRDMRLLRYLNTRINREVQREDEALCRRVQRGLDSGYYKPGPLSTLETCITQLHDLVRARIPQTRNDHPPAEWDA